MEFWDNSNEKNIENVRKMILEDDLSPKVFRMCIRESIGKSTGIKISEKSRQIIAKDVCRLK